MATRSEGDVVSVTTRSGRTYAYDPLTNRITLWENRRSDGADWTVRFVAATDYAFDGVSMFTIEMTQQCNLRCTYCIYSGQYEGRRKHAAKAMPMERLEQCVDFIVRHYNRSIPYITVCFYGGEALLERQKVEWMMQQLDERVPTDVHYTISTNGLLLNRAVVDWICSRPHVKVTVTLDGDRQHHDACRLSAGGKSTHSRILLNLAYFKALHPKEYARRVQFLSTVHSIDEIEGLSDYWERMPLLAAHRPVHISFIIPNFSKGDSINTDARAYTDFYDKALRDYRMGKENIMTDMLKQLIGIVEQRTVFDLPAEQRFITCLHHPYSCFIQATGDISVCERCCESHTIGTLDHGFEKERCQTMVERFTARKNKYCSKCWANRLCRICATCLNCSDNEFEQMCSGERMVIMLALRYYCEIHQDLI